MVPSPEATILVVSKDPSLADIRRSVLEAAGYNVINATSRSAIRDICKRKKPRLVLIGYSLPPSDKRHVWDEARKSCKVPILELHRKGKPELMPPAFFHESHTPDDFISAVKELLRN